MANTVTLFFSPVTIDILYPVRELFRAALALCSIAVRTARDDVVCLVSPGIVDAVDAIVYVCPVVPCVFSTVLVRFGATVMATALGYFAYLIHGKAPGDISVLGTASHPSVDAPERSLSFRESDFFSDSLGSQTATALCMSVAEASPSDHFLVTTRALTEPLCVPVSHPSVLEDRKSSVSVASFVGDTVTATALGLAHPETVSNNRDFVTTRALTEPCSLSVFTPFIPSQYQELSVCIPGLVNCVIAVTATALGLTRSELCTCDDCFITATALTEPRCCVVLVAVSPDYCELAVSISGFVDCFTSHVFVLFSCARSVPEYYHYTTFGRRRNG